MSLLFAPTFNPAWMISNGKMLLTEKYVFWWLSFKGTFDYFHILKFSEKILYFMLVQSIYNFLFVEIMMNIQPFKNLNGKTIINKDNPTDKIPVGDPTGQTGAL